MGKIRWYIVVSTHPIRVLTIGVFGRCDEMNMNERKRRIIEAIVSDYIASAEPISSRTISRKYNLGISPATIRNEMSDLEEMGFLAQTHAMSGRIPSDKAYRLYVDTIVRRRELTELEAEYLERIIQSNVSQIEYLMRETAKAIAHLTNYTTIISDPIADEPAIKHLRLMPLDDEAVLLVVICDSKAVKNINVYTGTTIASNVLNHLSDILNEHLSGLTLNEIGENEAAGLRQGFGEHFELLDAVLQALAGVMGYGDDANVYTSGIKNILTFPEFNDVAKAHSIFEALEEKDQLINLLGSGGNIEQVVEITIGEENEQANMKDLSIIKANYKINNLTGQIGIIGPKRMDYARAMSILRGAAERINKVLSGEPKNDEEARE